MICYDIANPKRLKRTAKILENFGIRAQYSFFQCEISHKMLNNLIGKILEVIDTDYDYLFVYPLCEECSQKAITDGMGSLIKLESFTIL